MKEIPPPKPWGGRERKRHEVQGERKRGTESSIKILTTISLQSDTRPLQSQNVERVTRMLGQLVYYSQLAAGDPVVSDTHARARAQTQAEIQIFSRKYEGGHNRLWSVFVLCKEIVP